MACERIKQKAQLEESWPDGSTKSKKMDRGVSYLGLSTGLKTASKVRLAVSPRPGKPERGSISACK